MPLARIGIGANLGDASVTVNAAIDALGRLGTVLRASSLYRTKPWGVTNQPDFVNAAVLLETALAPDALLAALQGLEREFGRTPGPRWGPRALDLDLLTYDDLSVDGPDLTLPHPRLFERAFVLVPLAEIDPSYAPARESLSPQERDQVSLLSPP